MQKREIKLLVYVVLYLVVLFYSCTEQSKPGTKEFIKKAAERITDKSLVEADKDSANWLSYGRNYSEDRYSPLVQIKIGRAHV